MKRWPQAVSLLLSALALPGAALAADPIKIGVITPLTGTYAPIGATVRTGLELAAKEVNAAGGVLGRPLELVFEDEEANPAVATQKAEKLLQVSKVDFLTGTVNSASTLAVGQLGERNNRLVSTTVSYSDAITGDKCSPNVFRVNARAGQQAAALAEWLAREKPAASIFYLGPDYEMGRNTVAAFKTAAEGKGLKSTGDLFAPLGTNDYTPFFGQIRAARAAVLYTAVAGNDTVRFLTQMQEYGLRKNVLVVGSAGTLSAQNLQATGTAADGFVTGVGYTPELDTPENKKFVAAYKAQYKADPDLFAADSYGLVYFYKAAVEKAKSTDTDKVRAAMRGLKWSTPQGVKEMRAGDHQAIQDMYSVRVTGGKFTVIAKVPGEAAIGPDTCTRF
jgi:branched-chain amino acid transport system substrate-binding protein